MLEVLAVLFTEVMSQNVMSSGSLCIFYSKSTGSYKTHTFHDDYNDHQTLAMPGRCIAAECNTTSGMGYCSRKTRPDMELDKCG